MIFKQYLKRNWQSFFKEEIPDNFDCIFLSSCLKEYGNDLILIFLNQSDYPRYIIKMARSMKYSFKIEREYNSLIHMSKNNILSNYTPYPYKNGNFNGCSFLIQGGIKGHSLHEILKKKGYTPYTKKLINQAVDLLVKINLTDISQECHSKKSRGNKISNFISRHDILMTKIGLTYSDLEPYIKQYEEGSYNNFFFLHGDYWGANILIDPSSTKLTGIIDWEFSKEYAKYPTDIIWFILNILFALNSKKLQSSSFSNIILSSLSNIETLHIIKECFERYASQIGIIDLNCVELFIYTLIEMSFRELITYGKSNKMDKECLSLLKHFITNKKLIKDINKGL